MVGLVWFYQKLEDCVRSRGVDVRPGLPSDPVFFPSLKQNETVLSIGDNILTEPLNEDSWELVFSDEQWLRILALKQIKELFIVDLKERTVDCEVLVTIQTFFFHLREYLLYRPGDQPKLFLVHQKRVHAGV